MMYRLVPVEPNFDVLYAMSKDVWPEDFNAGKTLQRAVGLEAIPPKTEYECAAGKWQRVLSSVPPLSDAEVDRLCVLMWGDDPEPRHGLVQHDMWALRQEQHRKMMRKFTDRLSIQPPASEGMK
jgi:hypothetical protein